ncbi:hypothetical protein MTO96_040692 [Rhipicephalus appendiculatus]
MLSQTSSDKPDIYTGVCTAGMAQWPSRWGLRAPVSPAVQPPLRYTCVGRAVVPACCVASLPVCRPASAYDGSVPGHGLMQHLRHPDCPASPRRPDTDNPVVPVL